MTTASVALKKAVRTRKTTTVPTESASTTKPVTPSVKTLKIYEESFTNLLHAVNSAKDDFMHLQKEIDEVRQSWVKEQNNHGIAIVERDQQKEVERKRESETYNYETMLDRKKTEDEFLEKKSKWERELEGRKEEIAKEKQELDNLRKMAGSFEQEKEKAVKDASLKLQKELTESFTIEKKLREQEVKSEQELLALKITNLTSENTRLANEIVMLRKSLEQATEQLKDVAVKVIEASSQQVKPSSATEP